MENKGVFTKILAITGTVLAWLPILAPILFSGVALIAGGVFRFDYLMPAELFPLALAGGLMLVWAALRARLQQKLIGWGFGSAILLLLVSQGLAIVTGLASGETEPAGWRMAVVLGGLVAFDLALVAVGVGGVLLLRDLYKPSN